MLVVSTLPHYLSVVPVLEDKVYVFIILTSSSFSVLWHTYNEPINWIFYLDYLFAGLWAAYDVYKAKQIKKVLLLNLIIFILNFKLDHSLWHIVSATKCFYVSIINTGLPSHDSTP
jgi:hypothetical protein